MACARCGDPCLGPICPVCKGFASSQVLVPTKVTALLGYQDPSGRDLVGQQNESIYDRMELLVRLLEGMAQEMRGLQPMSESLLKVSTQCKKLAADIEEEKVRRRGR